MERLKDTMFDLVKQIDIKGEGRVIDMQVGLHFHGLIY